jgi:heme/copper-type cytochrome/quinol oxidase subunit 1
MLKYYILSMPGLVGGFGNYLLPIMLGAADYKKLVRLIYTIVPQNNSKLGSYLSGL